MQRNLLEEQEMSSNVKTKIQAAVVSLALFLPAGNLFAGTHHNRYHHYRHVQQHHHHYSRTRGTLVGAAAGALIDHHHAVQGALIGGAIGNVVQHERSKH
jgi:hypothetical protein